MQKKFSDHKVRHKYNIMKWSHIMTCCFQKTIIKGNKKTIYRLDSEDLILLSWFQAHYENSKYKVICPDDGQEYLHVKYEKLSDDLTYMMLRKDTIYRKFKKLRLFGLVTLWDYKGKGRYDVNKCYYKINYELLNFLLYADNTTDNQIVQNIKDLHKMCVNEQRCLIDPVHILLVFMSDKKTTELKKEFQDNQCIINPIINTRYTINTNWNRRVLSHYINIITLSFFSKSHEVSKNSILKNNSNEPILKNTNNLNKNNISIPKKINIPIIQKEVPSWNCCAARPHSNAEITKKLYYLTSKEKRQIKYIKLWNTIAQEQKVKKFTNRMTVHRIPDNTNGEVPKGIKDICSVLVELKLGTFQDQHSFKSVNKDGVEIEIKRIPVQSEIDIKRVITDYSKLFIAGYSHKEYEINKTKLPKAMYGFIYNYIAQNSYYVSIYNSPVKQINKQLLAKIDLPEKVIQEYKKIFPKHYWDSKKESIYFALNKLKKTFIEIKSNIAPLYTLNTQYQHRFSTIPDFFTVHLKYLSKKFDFVDAYNTGHLNNDGAIWEKFKLFVAEVYGIAFTVTEKLKIEILNYEKIQAIVHSKKSDYDFIGCYPIAILSDEQIKELGAKEIKQKRFKLYDLNHAPISDELKQYFLDNFKIEDDTDWIVPGTGDIFDWHDEIENRVGVV